MTFHKVTKNLEVKDVTSLWKFKNRLIWFLFGISFTLSLHTIYRTINPVVCRDLAEDSLMLKMYDTMALKLKVIGYRDSQLTEKNFFEYTKLLGCSHPYETTAQGLYESGNFSPKSSTRFNNLFGFKDHEGYIRFRHWTYSVDFMVNSYQDRNGLKPGINYYDWIPKSYHQADRDVYRKGLRYIELRLRQKYK